MTRKTRRPRGSVHRVFEPHKAPQSYTTCREWVRDPQTGELRPCGKPKAVRKQPGHNASKIIYGCCEAHLKATTPIGNGWKGV